MSHYQQIVQHAREAIELIRLAQAHLIATRRHEDPLLRGYYASLIEFNETLGIMLDQDEPGLYDPENRKLKFQQYKAIQKLEDLAAKALDPTCDPAVRSIDYYQSCLRHTEAHGRPGRLLSFVALATCAAVQVMPMDRTRRVRPFEQLLNPSHAS